MFSFPVLLGCFIFMANLAHAIKVPPLEMEALSEFFMATNGANWFNNRGWDSLLTDEPTDPCGTAGVDLW
jgi:hypothetical protein